MMTSPFNCLNNLEINIFSEMVRETLTEEEEIDAINTTSTTVLLLMDLVCFFFVCHSLHRFSFNSLHIVFIATSRKTKLMFLSPQKVKRQFHEQIISVLSQIHWTFFCMRVTRFPWLTYNLCNWSWNQVKICIFLEIIKILVLLQKLIYWKWSLLI